MRDALSLLDQVLAFGGGRALEVEARSLLGTLDRRHVETILAALAAGDGKGLMQAVAALDERAPDYHQALGELAGALQRMALLQALPGLDADADDEDQALATLAGQFAPEDLQLYYQIAIMSRRDLDYAPDARGGFEMALLRMLAFRPLTATADGESPPAGHKVSRGRATAAGVAAGAPAGAAPAPVTPTKTEGAAEWRAMVATLDLQGPARQLANHCVLHAWSGDVLRLRLDRSGEMFRRPQLEQKLAQALSEHAGRPLRIEISMSDSVEDTPARRQAQASDERLRAAEEAIEADPAVRAMREVFGATVQPGSVKPLN
jgi:DNA polymerase-3 subunit gamma/tau